MIKCLTAELIFGIFSETYLGLIKLSWLKIKDSHTKIKVYIFLKQMNNRIPRVLKWPHKFQYVVAMVTKKTQIIFFRLIFPWLQCTYMYLLYVSDGIFKVILRGGGGGEIIRNILTPKSTKLHVPVQN